MVRGLHRVAAVFLTIALTVAATPALAGDYYDGLRAYDNGDYAEAARVWRESALSGDDKAQFRLGQLYENGEGVERDYVRALGWYLLAQEQGNADAGVAAYFLRRNMTEAQQEAAQEHAEAVRAEAVRGDEAETGASRRDGDAAPERGRSAEQGSNRAVASAEPRVEWWGRDRRSGPAYSRGATGEAIPDDKLRAMIAGSEIRDAVEVNGRMRYDLWQFRDDGTVHGTFSLATSASARDDRQGLDDGVWTVRDGLLCVTWDRWNDGRETCYRITVSRNGGWRLHNAETGAPAGDSAGRTARRIR